MKKIQLTGKQREKINDSLFAYSLLALPLITFALFYVYVNLNSFFLPFTDEVTGAFTFRYFEVFIRDLQSGAHSEILLNLKNTLIYFFTGLAQVPLTLVLSYFLFKKITGHKIFRVVYTLPMIVSSVIYVSIYKSLWSAGGPIDSLVLKHTGHTMTLYPLYTPGWATFMIVIYGIWVGFGMGLILQSGAMARIPDAILESAKIDGCGFFREMWQIVLPMIWPTISIQLLMSFVGVFSASGDIILFSGGMYETSTINYWMYDYVIKQSKYNYAAAFGLMLTIATVPIVIITRKISNMLDKDVSF